MVSYQSRIRAMKLPSAERVNVRRLLLDGLADRRANNVPDTALVKIHGTVCCDFSVIMINM